LIFLNLSPSFSMVLGKVSALCLSISSESF
jgi:hypothetical protein